MADIKIVKEWLVQAGEDFDFASFTLEESDRFFSRICFHFQQAGEKYLKAFIVAYDLPFEKIHDLVRLLKICQKKDASFESLAEQVKFLTDFYVDTRYPTLWPVGRIRKEAEKAKEAIQTIKEISLAKVPLQQALVLTEGSESGTSFRTALTARRCY